MAKFCGNCGAPLDEDARVCGQCGTPVEGKKVIDPKEIKNERKIKRIIITVVVLVVLGVIGFGIFKIVYNFTGTIGFTRKVMNAYKEYDIDTIVDMSSDKFFYDNIYDSDGAESYFKDIIGSNFDEYENIMGPGFDMKYKILDKYELSERRKERVLEDIEYRYNEFDSSIIDDLTEVNVKIILDKKGTPVKRNISLLISEEEGKLRLFDIYNK